MKINFHKVNCNIIHFANIVPGAQSLQDTERHGYINEFSNGE